MTAAELTAWVRAWRAVFGVPVFVLPSVADSMEDLGVDTVTLERDGALSVIPFSLTWGSRS